MTAPAIEEWHEALTRFCRRYGVSVGDVLSGIHTKPVRLARWEAWREIINRHPGVSINRIAKLTGYDHSTITNGMKKLDRTKAIYLAQIAPKQPKPAPLESPEVRMRRLWKASAPLTTVPGGAF